MASVELQGTVEEQAGQLYDMADEAMAEGRYSAAVRYLAEIERAVPGFRDTPQRLALARRAKREQRFLLYCALAGGILAIALARLLGAQSEIVLLGSGAAGLMVGYFAGSLLFGRSAGG